MSTIPPHNSLIGATMSFSFELEAILLMTKTSDIVRAWLTTVGIEEPMDITLAAEDEVKFYDLLVEKANVDKDDVGIGIKQ